EEMAAVATEIERLLADAIAGQNELAPIAVPQAEREHALRPAERGLDAPALEAREQDLGIGMPAERIAGRLQLGAQLPEVVDLAVVADGEAPRGRGHRLGAGGRQIDDREPPMTEGQSDALLDPDPAVVRSPVRERVGHRPRAGAERRRGSRAPEISETAYAAHREATSWRRRRRAGRWRNGAVRAPPPCCRSLFGRQAAI